MEAMLPSPDAVSAGGRDTILMDPARRASFENMFSVFDIGLDKKQKLERVQVCGHAHSPHLISRCARERGLDAHFIFEVDLRPGIACDPCGASTLNRAVVGRRFRRNGALGQCGAGKVWGQA